MVVVVNDVCQVPFGASDWRDCVPRPYIDSRNYVVVRQACLMHHLLPKYPQISMIQPFVFLTFPVTLMILGVHVFMLLNWHDRLANAINIPLSVETVCVFTAPVFSAFASWATFLLTKVSALLEWIQNNSIILTFKVQIFSSS